MIVDRPPARHPYTEAKVVLLSGLSDPSSCALAPPQTRFLEGLEIPEAWKVYWNFPYLSCPEIPRREPPLWLAGARNLGQFLSASGRRYQDAARRHWGALETSAGRLVVITLSCGLEIVNQCLGAAGPVGQLQIIALGPVAWARPKAPCVLVRGSRDWISGLFFRRSDVILPGAGHMNYLEDGRVSRLVKSYL
jgi:hypothetical protein